MTDMVERVAREMAAKEGWRWNDERQMLDCAAAGLQNTNRERDTWRNRARAAIEAMRIPTKAMLDAVSEEEDRQGYVAAAYESMDAEAAWPVMISAALKSHEDKSALRGKEGEKA